MQSQPAIAEQYPSIILLILIGVLACALGLFAYCFVLPERKRDFVQTHFTIELLAIVITAFTAFLAFATGPGQALMSQSEASGTIGVLTFKLVGPAAVWAGARALLKWASPFGQFVPQVTRIDDFMKLSEDKLGWLGYDEWKQEVGQFKEVIDNMELHFIDDLLPKVYYHGPLSANTPMEPEIRTVFIYRSTGIVKLQRIRGTYQGGDRPLLYLPATPSTPSGKLRSMYGFIEDGKISKLLPTTNGAWKPTTTNIIDCLLVTTYEADVTDIGDYLYVDTTKYTRASGHAYVELSILSERNPRNMQFWELRASSVSNRQPAPLIFRRIPHGATAHNDSGKLMTDVFCDAFKALMIYDKNDESSEFIATMCSCLGITYDERGKATWSKYVTRKEFTGKQSFWNRDQESVLISTFEWAS